MVEILTDSFSDVIKVFPVFFILVLLADVLTKRVVSSDLLIKFSRFDYLIGAAAGLIPQCGIPVAAAKLYSSGYLTLGMLMAVFIASSDEALIIIGTHPDKIDTILLVLLLKVVIAVIAGGLIKIFIKEKRNRIKGCSADCSCPRCRQGNNIVLASFIHSLKITGFLFITVFLINLGLEKLGEETFYGFTGRYSFYQPVYAALIGVIPSCFSSVFIAEGYLKGVIGTGSMIAGLCANTGYGILILFKEVRFKIALKIMFLILLISIFAGETILLFGG